MNNQFVTEIKEKEENEAQIPMVDLNHGKNVIKVPIVNGKPLWNFIFSGILIFLRISYFVNFYMYTYDQKAPYPYEAIYLVNESSRARIF